VRGARYTVTMFLPCRAFIFHVCLELELLAQANRRGGKMTAGVVARSAARFDDDVNYCTKHTLVHTVHSLVNTLLSHLSGFLLDSRGK
jgi:hypothetical protein